MHCAGFLLVWMASLVLFWAPLQELLRLSLENDRYTHIVMIPLISLCLMCWKRKSIFFETRWNPGFGLPGLLLGAALYVAGRQRYNLSLLLLGIVVTWTAAFILCCGLTAFKAARFKLLLLLLMVPIPPVIMGKLISVLQTGSADLSYAFFRLAGVPVFRQGFTFDLPNVGIEIAKECSSIHSGWALFITGLLVGHEFLRSLWSKITLSFLAVPIAVFTNAIRIFTIWSLGTRVDIGFLSGKLHHRGGILFSLISVFLLLASLLILRRLEDRISPTAPRA